MINCGIVRSFNSLTLDRLAKCGYNLVTPVESEISMNLVPLRHIGDVTPVQFAEWFADRLGSQYARALKVLQALDPMHSFSVSNCIELSLQKGNTDEVLMQLERWAELALGLPNPCPEGLWIRFNADTKYFFDLVYGECFMGEGVTLDGMAMPHPVTVEEMRQRSRAPSPGRLVIPGQSEPMLNKQRRGLILP